MCVTFCGRFAPNKGRVVGYVDRMRGKYTAKWGVQMAEMNYQTGPGSANPFGDRGTFLGRLPRSLRFCLARK
ncbi:DUF6783 domain-containing protein [Hungatella hominis]|uniref:DUF6783 domain-containing protein n=1 Tax=Hungatella TaxID=1649459 RepID=UPI0032E38036